jgi:molybdopterin-binding protein
MEITTGGGLMKISARNVLKGKVIQINQGAVNSEVRIRLPGGEEIVSMITKTSARHLRPAKNKEVYAVIKASNVMIATE